MPRMISTSCMRGTGFMKWMPMNFSGRSVTEASRVIEMDDVLVASMQSGRKRGTQVHEDLAFDLFIFRGRFDDEIAFGESIIIERRRDPADGGDARCLVELLALDETREISAERGEASIDPFLGNVVEGDVESGDRADLRDPGAHLPGADDADRVDFNHEFLPRGMIAD